MSSDRLLFANCQFPVEADLALNRGVILAQIDEAADRGARVVQFPEAALSGYAGVDIENSMNIDWPALREATLAICERAKQCRVWVLLGSTHRLSDGRLPHNSVYVIDDQGEIVERYDKRFCTGVLRPSPELDLEHYSPGDHACVFDVDGFRCGVLICYDYRFPELYRDLKRRGVEVLFQSFHNARRRTDEDNIWIDIVPATLMCRAATNHLWISAANSAAQVSSWGNFHVQPDGRLAEQLERHQAGVLVGCADRTRDFWDASEPWRDRAMQGRLHSGEVVSDPRSQDRSCM